MRVTWDPAKATANGIKHRIAFPDAEGTLYDELAITDEDPRHDERRFITIGRDWLGRILVVVFTYPDDEPDTIRLISARKAKRSERERYENAH